MEDIVKRLRTQVTNRSQVAYDAADEIESLRAQLAELKDERNALLEEESRMIRQASNRAFGEYKTIQSQLVELQRENARLREDAERYRYAQEHLRIGLAKFDSWSHCDCDFTDMDDAAIDAHRAKKDSYQ